jgi:iron complex transport system ATP-binding protein
MSPLLGFATATVSLGRKPVVRDVSLRVSTGEIVALLGPNGAGKTSLIRAALGFAPLDRGTVRLGNADPGSLSARQRALCAAYLPQRPQSIWPVSVERLAALGRYAHGAPPDRLSATDQSAVDLALEACGLTALRDRRMDQISGGEKARAHLARVLAQHAPLLLLDEPTAGLDPAQALGVADILRKHANVAGAVLFSTHDVALAARTAHRVVLMREGAVISEGAPESALSEASLTEAYGREGRVERVGADIVAVFR